MSNRQIGTLTSHAPRTVGKFYQTQRPPQQANNMVDRNQCAPDENKAMRSQTKSVGRIYNSRLSGSKERLPEPSAIKIGYQSLINYSQIQNKLSSYLECTIRTNSRQKYNYLSSHYNPKYQTLAKNYQVPYQPSYTTQSKNGQYRLEHRDQLSHTNTTLRDRVHEANALLKQKVQYQQKERPVQPCKQKENQINFMQREKQQIIPQKENSQKKSLKNSRKSENKQNKQMKQNKQNKNVKQSVSKLASTKKESPLGIITLNHEQHKNQLQNKLKKMINSYELKNKQLQNELKKIEVKPEQLHKQQRPVQGQSLQNGYSEDELKATLNKLIEFNLKGINLTRECDDKLQEIWKSIHQQIILDEQLRLVKCFINESNINTILTTINQSRIKKIEINQLKTHPDQYDPFLIEKFNQYLKSNNPNLAHRHTCKWITQQFLKFLQLSERNWLKQLSQQKIECIVRAMILQKDVNEVGSLRRPEGASKQMPIRDFTRYLSTLYKANLRNRNVYQIHSKLQGMSYLGRLIELLEEKAGKGADIRKINPTPK